MDCNNTQTEELTYAKNKDPMYDDDNRAGLFVKVQDKDQPNLTKTFRIMIDEVEEAF